MDKKCCEKCNTRECEYIELNYCPIAVRQSNEIAYEVSSDHVNAVNRSISRKVQRNETEKNASRDVAARYVVR